MMAKKKATQASALLRFQVGVSCQIVSTSAVQETPKNMEITYPHQSNFSSATLKLLKFRNKIQSVMCSIYVQYHGVYTLLIQ